jgi:hypothetical protein
MIDWTAVAIRLGYTTERDMWMKLYVHRGLSIPKLSEQLGVTRNSIREALLRCEIELRQRGGVHNRRYPKMSAEDIRTIRQEGIANAARRLNIPYNTMYKRVQMAEERIEREALRQEILRRTGG